MPIDPKQGHLAACLESGAISPEALVEAVTFIDQGAKTQGRMMMEGKIPRESKLAKRTHEQKRVMRDVADLALMLTRNAKAAS